MKRSFWGVGLAALLMCGLVVAPALASGGASGSGQNSGGTTSGGGSGGGGGTTTTAPTYSTATLTPYYYSGVTATGTAIFGYTLDGSYKSLEISVGGLSYPDGTQLSVDVYMTRPDPTAYYGTSTTVSSGYLVVAGGAAHLYVSSANGDVVPDFPLPGAGTTTLYVRDPNGAYLLSGTMGTVAKQKRNGGGA
jgi:hypothetical protein